MSSFHTQPEKVLVCGAGGFIGGHLVRRLRDDGAKSIRAVDIKPADQWFQLFPEVENLVMDLRDKDNCYRAVDGCGHVYNLAADMGGMGFIENNKTACMLSVLINTHLLMAARDMEIDRYFYSSSACVYAADKQLEEENPGLRESDAYPAEPEDGYGWEKLFSERMCRHFREDHGLETRIARFHNCYGPWGTYDGGREKAPAAMCRKVIQAKIDKHVEIDIWGDGNQTRSFTYVDDCVTGILSIMASNVRQPINLGSSEMVTINRLVDIVEEIAGIKLRRYYRMNAPLGVRGRNSDNTMIREYLNWEPEFPLQEGMEKTYAWIYDQIIKTIKNTRAASAAVKKVGHKEWD